MADIGNALSGARLEIQLILACSRTRVDSEGRDAIRALAGCNLDWSQVVDLSETHRVMPMVYTNLRTAAAKLVPERELGRLESLFYSNSLRNFRLRDELIRILRELQSRGIQAVPYKGPAIAEGIYGDLSLRAFGDLDILARRDQIPQATEALLALGYALEERHCVPDAAAFQTTHHHVFRRAPDDIYVELHWDVADPFLAVSLRLDRFWKRLTTVRLGGVEVPGIPPEYLLLFLCIHHTAEEWSRLIQVCDIAEIVRAEPHLDWQLLRHQARTAGASRMVNLGLFLAHALLQAQLPESVFAEVTADSVALGLAAAVWERLLDASSRRVSSADLARVSRFRLHARERMRDKARYLLAAAFLPSLDDWRWVSLPRQLHWLYFLLRPVRMMVKYLLR